MLAPGTFAVKDAASGGGWVFSNSPTSPGAGLTRPASPYTAVPAPEESQVAMIQRCGRFHKNVDFGDGGIYLLSFKVGSRTSATSSDGKLEYEVRIDDVPIHNETTTSAMPYTYREVPLSVTAGKHTLSFVGYSSTDQTAFFDDVEISRMPGYRWITGLFNTGVLSNSKNGLLAVLADPGDADAHYRLISPMSLTAVGLGQIPPWRSNGPNSSWIGFAGSETYAPKGQYIYEFSFVLPANAKPNTVRFSGFLAADNGFELILNGVSTGFANTHEGTFPTFQYIFMSPGSFPFVVGTNTFRIVVTNTYGPGTTNPSGLRFEQLRGIFEIDPEIGSPVTDLQISSAMELKWTGLPGFNYRVQYSTNLESDWEDLTGDMTGTGDALRVCDPVGGTARRFYRVIAFP